MRKFFDIVRVIKGFYKGSLGVVIDKSSPHINGMVGESPHEVYQVMLQKGSKIIDAEERDLQTETLPEIAEEEKETGEDIENAVETEEDIENNGEPKVIP